MAKPTKALMGRAKDAYLERVLAAEPAMPEDVRARLGERLKGEVSSLRLKPVDPDAATPVPSGPAPIAFDPYSPNVVVVIRTSGREAVLSQLSLIDCVDHLRLLAREQQLTVASDLADAEAIRLAIVAAAERRIANRRAAAS